jgi:hypothetical protein
LKSTCRDIFHWQNQTDCRFHPSCRKKTAFSIIFSSMAPAVTISLPADDATQDQAHIDISQVEDVASYNWLDKHTPTVLVPGIPPVWHVPAITPHLKPDTGTCYVDQNLDRNPWSPLEPLIRAIITTHPDFDFNGLDIVTDRWPIRRLLEFVGGAADDFEFGLEVLGKAVLFTRMEKQSRQLISPGTFQGYRRAFEEAYTKIPSSAQGSTSHHRVIRYRIGSLQLLVRFAVDAYLQEEIPGHIKSASKDIYEPKDLVTFMKATSLSTDAPSIDTTPEAPGVTVVRGGQVIAHSALLELTTRFKFARVPFDIENKFPDLWLSQMQHYVVAFHQNVGTKWSRQKSGLARLAEFKDIEIKHISEDHLRSWEESNQTDIRKLVMVLQQILNQAMAMEAPCIVRYSKSEGHLTLSKVAGEKFAGLPKDLRGKFFDEN